MRKPIPKENEILGEKGSKIVFELLKRQGYIVTPLEYMTDKHGTYDAVSHRSEEKIPTADYAIHKNGWKAEIEVKSTNRRSHWNIGNEDNFVIEKRQLDNYLKIATEEFYFVIYEKNTGLILQARLKDLPRPRITPSGRDMTLKCFFLWSYLQPIEKLPHWGESRHGQEDLFQYPIA